MGELSQCKGLGPASEKCLNQIGIYTCAGLRDIGAVRAFARLQQYSDKKPSLNLLYAMVGALENRHWASIAKTEKARLLMELDDCLRAEGISSNQK